MFHGKEIQPKGKISARDYNEIRKKVMNNNQDRITAQSHFTPNPVIVRVRNMTNDILPEFSVVGIKTPMYSKETKEDFNNQGTAYGVELEARPWDSSANNHEAQSFGVLCKRAAPNSLVYAVIAGPTPVQITHYNSVYPYALPQNGVTSSMRAMPFGPAKIIWIDTENPEELDTQQCDSTPRNAYIDIQNQQWWQFFELQEDLESCSSADAIACYHCGGQIGPCEIHRTIWLPQLGCESDGIKLPENTIVLAHWFEQENKWIAINWKEDCPDFEEFTPSTSSIVKTAVPARFEVTHSTDPCNPGTNEDGCAIKLVYNETKYYKNNCGLFCVYDTAEKKIPLELPVLQSYIPISCTITDQQKGTDDQSYTPPTHDPTDPCDCTSSRWIHMVYPEIEINCGKVCTTGNTLTAPGCDISLTQDEPITQYDTHVEYEESSDPCEDGCSTLTITRRSRTAKIACDEWCYGSWTNETPIEIPIVASDGGEITYVDNIHLTQSSECGCLQLVVDYGTAEVHCGAICEPTITSSSPVKVCLGGTTETTNVVTDFVSGTVTITGEPTQVLSDATLELSGLSLTGGTPINAVTSVNFDATNLTLGGISTETVVKTVGYTEPSLSTNSVSIPTISGATLDDTKITLLGQDVTVLTGASITPVTAELTYGEYPQTVLTDVTQDTISASISSYTPTSIVSAVTTNIENLTVARTSKTVGQAGDISTSNLSIKVPLTLVTGGTITGTIKVSIPIVKKTVVTSVSVDNCNVIGTTDDVYCINTDEEGNLDIDVTLDGTELTFTPTSTTADHDCTISGTLSVGSTTVYEPTGAINDTGYIYATTGSINIPTAISISGGTLHKTTTTIDIPTDIEITGGVLTTSDTVIPMVTGVHAESGAIALTAGASISAVGSASLSGGSVSTTTATISTPTSITASTTPITTTTSSVTVPTGVSGTGGINKTFTTINAVTTGSATISNIQTTKKALSFNHGVLCDGGSN